MILINHMSGGPRSARSAVPGRELQAFICDGIPAVAEQGGCRRKLPDQIMANWQACCVIGGGDTGLTVWEPLIAWRGRCYTV